MHHNKRFVLQLNLQIFNAFLIEINKFKIALFFPDFFTLIDNKLNVKF